MRKIHPCVVLELPTVPRTLLPLLSTLSASRDQMPQRPYIVPKDSPCKSAADTAFVAAGAWSLHDIGKQVLDFAVWKQRTKR